MLEREEVMRNAMVELNAKLMAAETLLTRIPAENASTHQHEVSMDESVPVQIPQAIAKKYKVDSRRHQTKIIIPGGRVLRSTASYGRATLQGAATTGDPIVAMDTLADGPTQTVPQEDEAATHALSPPAVETPKAPRVVGRKTGNTSHRKKKAVVVKAAAEVFRFLPREMPTDMGGLHKATALHIRILWALLDAKAVPINPPSSLLADFNTRFSTHGQLYVTQASGAELIPCHLIQIGTSMSAVKGHIAEQARHVEQNMLNFIQTCLSRFGLNCWCPDLRQSAYSLYNSACRIIAIDTFKQALVSHTYLALAPNTSYASNMDVLVKLYDHFVFHYMRLRYRRDGRTPGSVTLQLQASPQYQERIRLAASRLKFLVENNYPGRYCALIDSKATSDDEYDPGQKAWIVKRRPERSETANQWFRILDQKHRETVDQHPTRVWRERLRIVPSDPSKQENSAFIATPDNMPLDYFDPIFFNNLQPRTRNRIATTRVSFIPNITLSFTWCAARVSDKAFNKKYGSEKHALYNMVRDEEIEDDADDEWDDDSPADDVNMEMSDAATVRDNAARDDLSAHMSSGSASISGTSSFVSVSSSASDDIYEQQ